MKVRTSKGNSHPENISVLQQSIVEIKRKDYEHCISQKEFDKVFQPFFNTKPAGKVQDQDFH